MDRPGTGRDDTTQRKDDANEPLVVDVRALMGERREIVLVHQGKSYRLRITARDRLILTK